MRYEELKQNLLVAELPNEIILNGYIKISDVPTFVDTHICILDANRNNKTFKPYYDRLLSLNQSISLKSL